MTLAEIMVCVAVVAIAITMVVSFAALMSERTQVSRARLELQQDLTMIETIAESWLEQMAAKNATFTVNGSTITATIPGSEPHTLSYAYGTLSGTLPDSRTMTARTTQIDKVTFSLEENSKDKLFFCTVSDKASGEEMIFAINPRAGEAVGGST